MSETVKAICDAVIADIEALPLPVHRTFKYVKSRDLRTDQGSWLNVFPSKVIGNVISTVSSYDSFVIICVDWVLPTFSGVESNIGDQAKAESGIVTAQLITDRLRTYGAGVPGLFNCTATVEEVDFDLDQNLSWCASTMIQVEVFEGPVS